jgi:hypothetical protein
LKPSTKRVVVTASFFLVLACNGADAQNTMLNLPRNRQQKVPTPGYKSKAYPLNPQSAHKIQKPNRFIPLASKNTGSPQRSGGKPVLHPGEKPVTAWAPGSKKKDLLPKGPGLSPDGKPITAWEAGKKKNYSTLYQDSH